MSEDLRKKTFWGIVWSYIGRFGSQIIAIIPAMILARMLGPEQYGLIAMAGVFTGIAYQLADAGFGNALVQKRDADNIDFSTVFYFNIGICGIIYLIIYLCAPLIAEFFHERLLIPIIRFSSLGIIILSFGQIQTIIFKKEIDYKRQVIINLTCQIISAVIAIIMAINRYGVWALVAQGLIYTFCTTIMNWIISSWRPMLVFSRKRLLGLFNYGSKTLASSIIDYGFSKLYDIIIGRVYNPTSLGLYNRAISTSNIFKDTFFGVFSGVTFPVFVKMQHDNERFRNNIIKFISIVSMLIFTAMIWLIFMAHPLFIFMYSSKWDGAVTFFQLACVMAMLTPIISILESVILAKGYSGKFLAISIIRKIFVVTMLAIAWRFGVLWLLIGQIIVNICECLIYSFVTKRIINYSFLNVISDLYPSLLLALVSVIPVAIVDYAVSFALMNADLDITLAAIIRLAIGAIVITFSFFTICKSVKLNNYKELIHFLEHSIGSNKIVTWLKV